MAEPGTNNQDIPEGKSGSGQNENINLDSLVGTLSGKLTDAIKELAPGLEFNEGELKGVLDKINESIKDKLRSLDPEVLNRMQDKIVENFSDEDAERAEAEAGGEENQAMPANQPEDQAIEPGDNAPTERGVGEAAQTGKMNDSDEQDLEQQKQFQDVISKTPGWAGNKLQKKRQPAETQNEDTSNQLEKPQEQPALTEQPRTEEQSSSEPNNKRQGADVLGMNMRDNNDQQTAEELERERQPAKLEAAEQAPQDNPDENNYDVDDLLSEHEQRSAQELSKSSDTKGGGIARSAGEQYGKKLDNAIRNGDFKSFAIALALAIVKDAWDLIDPVISAGIAGSIVNIFISAMLYYIVYMSQYGWIKRYLMKYVHKKLLRAILIEFVPILGFIPMYTILVLMIKRKIDGKRKDLIRKKAELGIGMESIESANAGRSLLAFFKKTQGQKQQV